MASRRSSKGSGPTRVGTIPGVGIEHGVRAAVADARRVEAHAWLWHAHTVEEALLVGGEGFANAGYAGSDENHHKIMARTKMHEKDGMAEADHEMFTEAAAGADVETTTAILEKHLDTKPQGKQATAMVLLRALKLDKVRLAVENERKRRSKESFVHPFPLVHRFVRLTIFEFVVGVLMCVNAIIIGFQTSVAGTDDETEFYDIMEHVFTALFILEVLIRMLADGWVWICSATNLWDVALILFTSVLPMWLLKPLGLHSDGIRFFSVIRVLRLIKLVRMVRLVPLFKVLYHLVIGIQGSARTLLFTYLMVGIMLYMFAVASVTWIGRSEVFRDDELGQKYFGTVPAAALTLFQVMTCDWTSVARPLTKKSQTVNIVAMCVAAIMVMTLVVQNLITAVICNSAFTQAKQDEELQALEKRDMLKAQIQDLKDLFREIDTDNSGVLSHQEYLQAARENQRVRQKLAVLSIGEKDAEEIWNMLDDGSGGVRVERFADLLHSLQGDALAKDSFTIVRRLRKTQKRITQLTRQLEEQSSSVQELRALALTLDKQLGRVLCDVSEMAASVGMCLPREKLLLTPEELLKAHSKMKRKSRLKPVEFLE